MSINTSYRQSIHIRHDIRSSWIVGYRLYTFSSSKYVHTSPIINTPTICKIIGVGSIQTKEICYEVKVN